MRFPSLICSESLKIVTEKCAAIQLTTGSVFHFLALLRLTIGMSLDAQGRVTRSSALKYSNIASAALLALEVSQFLERICNDLQTG